MVTQSFPRRPRGRARRPWLKIPPKLTEQVQFAKINGVLRNKLISSYFSHLLEYYHQNQVFHQEGLGLELGLEL